MQQVVDEIRDRTIRPLASQLPLDNAFEITEVYEGSVAHAAGLTEGMVYIADAEDRDSDGYRTLAAYSSSGARVSRFADLSKGEEILLTTARFPFGLDMLPTTERICRTIREGGTITTEAMDRIHRGNRLDLADIMDAMTLRDGSQTLGSSLLKSFRAITSSERDDLDERVENIIIGVWAAENGDLDRAASVLPDSDDGSVQCHGGVLTSLYFYAVALCIELSGGSTVDVTSMLELAQEYNSESLLVRRKLAAVSGRTSMPNTRKPEPFPILYSLPAHDPLHGPLRHGCTYVSLDDTLRSLTEKQFAIVILLGGYRCNGYYSLDMEKLTALSPLLGQHFPQVHIITSAPPDWEYNDWWMDGEAEARQAGVPFKILYDLDDDVSHAVEADTSPHISIIDRNGLVVNNNTMGIEEGLWNAIQRTVDAAKPPKPAPPAEAAPEPKAAPPVAELPAAAKPKQRRFGRPPPGFTL